MKHDILFELGTEELPSGLVKPLAKNVLNLLLQYLDEAEMTYGATRYFSSPRRIGVVIQDVPARQENRMQVRRGPANSAAHDANGAPSKALLGFARSCGVELDALTLETTDKGQWWIYQYEQEGQTTSSLLPELFKQAVVAVNIPKPMRWGAETFAFARPVHWAILMYGDQVLDTDILGVNTQNLSYGHRFHHPQSVLISAANDYEKALFEAKVIVDFEARRQEILRQIDAIAIARQLHIPCPDDLLDEITSINEWPVVFIADFAEEFLRL
ncbi:MAG: glycine--tRNA ligase subunit beta, partial [Gammaproteobacteria bacterium]|nr:glycine--tRNA ligase subunit beta [Gammaproteobacteria bacterium]